MLGSENILFVYILYDEPLIFGVHKLNDNILIQTETKTLQVFHAYIYSYFVERSEDRFIHEDNVDKIC